MDTSHYSGHLGPGRVYVFSELESGLMTDNCRLSLSPCPAEKASQVLMPEKISNDNNLGQRFGGTVGTTKSGTILVSAHRKTHQSYTEAGAVYFY